MNALGALLLVLLAPVALYALARWVGLGRCLSCGRACLPWSACCWTHSPDNPEAVPGGEGGS